MSWPHKTKIKLRIINNTRQNEILTSFQGNINEKVSEKTQFITKSACFHLNEQLTTTHLMKACESRFPIQGTFMFDASCRLRIILSYRWIMQGEKR